MSSGTTPLPYDDIKGLPQGSGPFNLVVHITAKPGKEAEVKDYLRKIRDVANSDQEPGTLTYNVSKSNAGPETYIVYEVYKDAAAVKAHTDGPIFKELFSKAGELVEIFHPRWYTHL